MSFNIYIKVRRCSNWYNRKIFDLYMKIPKRKRNISYRITGIGKINKIKKGQNTNNKKYLLITIPIYFLV